MQKVTEIGVVSFAKIMAVSSILLTLVICVPAGLVVILMSIIGGGAGAGAGAGAMGVGSGIMIMVMVPVLYGAASFVIGLIYGLILNFVLSLAGGFELKIETAGHPGA